MLGGVVCAVLCKKDTHLSATSPPCERQSHLSKQGHVKWHL